MNEILDTTHCRLFIKQHVGTNVGKKHKYFSIKRRPSDATVQCGNVAHKCHKMA